MLKLIDHLEIFDDFLKKLGPWFYFIFNPTKLIAALASMKKSGKQYKNALGVFALGDT